MDLCIFGTGGSAKEIFWLAKQCGRNPVAFIDPYSEGELYNIPIKKENFLNPLKHTAIVAVGSPQLRKKIASEIWQEHGDCFDKLIHPSVIFLGNDIELGSGAVVYPKCILTCNIIIGTHCQLNCSTTISHDFKGGDFFTAACNVSISGNVMIGDCVFFGANASTKERVKITDNVTIGASACVTKNIMENGTYIGIPARKM